MFYTIYKVTNKINGKYYIGKHKTKDLNDGYMGSGKRIKRSIKKYGSDNFTKEILYVFDNEQEMNDKEKELVIINEMSYNLCPGGQGGFGYINTQGINNRGHEDVPRKLRNFLLGRKNPTTSKTLKKRHALGLMKYDNFSGKKHSVESKEKIGKANKGKTPWNKGIPRTEEEKKRISEAVKLKNLSNKEFVY